MLKRWPAFTLFLDDGRVCVSNNAAERRLRGVALGRNYAQPVIMRSSRVQALHAPRRISGIMLSLKAPLYA
jgi:hypothetical protein